MPNYIQFVRPIHRILAKNDLEVVRTILQVDKLYAHWDHSNEAAKLGEKDV